MPDGAVTVEKESDARIATREAIAILSALSSEISKAISLFRLHSNLYDALSPTGAEGISKNPGEA